MKIEEINTLIENKTLKEAMIELDNIPQDVLEDVLRYEEEYLRKEMSKGKSQRKFPSNEDVVEAILEVTGGIVYSSTLENLYDMVKKRLEEKGYETKFVNEKRILRLLSSLAKKKRVKLEL